MKINTYDIGGKPYVLHSEAEAAGYFMDELMGIGCDLFPLVGGKIFVPLDEEVPPEGLTYQVDDWAIPQSSWQNYQLNFTLNNLCPLTGKRVARASKRGTGRTYRTYIIEAVGSGLVKIGRAGDCLARLKQLQTAQACELRILKDHPLDIEAELHRRFAEARVKGEWFAFGADIRNWLAANPD